MQNILRLLSSTFPQLIFLGCPPPKHQQKCQFLLTLTSCLRSCWNVALGLTSMTTQLIPHSCSLTNYIHECLTSVEPFHQLVESVFIISTIISIDFSCSVSLLYERSESFLRKSWYWYLISVPSHLLVISGSMYLADIRNCYVNLWAAPVVLFPWSPPESLQDLAHYKYVGSSSIPLVHILPPIPCMVIPQNHSISW